MKTKLLFHRIMIVILVIAMTAFLLGCLPTSENDTSTLIATSSQFPVSSMTLLESTPTTSAPPTRKPTATFAPTRTPLPIQTDLPTIESDSINAMIDSLYSRCELPCWGSIIPGKTNQFAAKRFLAPLGEWRTTSVSFDYNNASTSINLTFEDGLVRSTHLYPGLTRPYRINRLFTEYGMPEDVQVEVLPLTYELSTWFNLILMYPSQGFFAILSAEGTVIDSIINICPRNVSPDLYLFASDTYSLDEMNEIVSIVRPHTEFQPLDTVTDMDINQFYEIFRNQSVNCIAANVKFQLP